MTYMGHEFSRHDIEFSRETAASYDAQVTGTFGVHHSRLLEPRQGVQTSVDNSPDGGQR